MADGNAYSRRLRSHRHSDSTSSEDEEELRYVTRNSGRRYGVYTPEPVQRTLKLRPDDVEDEDEDSDFEGIDDYSVPIYRSTTYSPPLIHEENVNEFDDGEEESVDEHETFEHETQRSELKKRAAGAAEIFKSSYNIIDVWQKAINLKIFGMLSKYFRRLWRFVLRNSFMAVNVLWLLAPLCCFVIAVTAPQYMTTAIQYVDILSLKAFGVREGAQFDKGTMRSVVQEIVDMKLVGINEELGLLRQTVRSQELEIKALKLLHDTLRHDHDDQFRMLSIAEPHSLINIHIDSVVAKHTEGLRDEFTNTTLQLGQDLQTAAKQQSDLFAVLKKQKDEIDLVQDMLQKSSSGPTSDAANENARVMSMINELKDWRESFEHKMKVEMQRKVHEIESRLSSVLQDEKSSLSSSVDAFRGLDATDPGILRVIEVAVQAVEIKKTGRVDHAALANGASIIYSERDLLYQEGSSLTQLLNRIVGLSVFENEKFTSPSFRRAPNSILGQLLSSGENPWWLSRHNGRPETALSETMEIGSCWGIAGSSGRLSVKFAQQIIADAVTIDHIPAQIASDFSSAPYQFRILGIAGHPLRETVDLISFGNFSYASKGPASQSFRLTSPLSQRSPIDGITLEILSNHGNAEYTCLYRFRVHGQLAKLSFQHSFTTKISR
ncbi:putative SUN domain-containing protein [Plasmopara halstedii]